MRYFIYIIKAGLQALSERTEGQIKTSIRTSCTIETNDKIIGFCEKPIAEYRYLFNGESIESNKITMNKVLQVLTGVKSNTLLPDVEKKINEAIESSDDLVEISQEQYDTIKNKILEQLNNTLENTEIKKITSETSKDYFSDYEQIIFYGVPGCGKSYCIDSKLKELGITGEEKEEQTKRVVFHPEYTNSDFIGQILPKVEGEKVKYEFAPGPFTEILKKAYENKSKPYALIIEEINRGNAAAIFGELFQLLDRFEEKENETVSEYKYSCGWSSYCVNNDNINQFIRDKYDEKDAFIPLSIFDKYKLNIGIRLPPNLSLFATMNTSDQNVYKLDNAFKRRWNLQLIPNEFDLTDEIQRNQCNSKIQGFNFTWGEFILAVNKIIIGDTDDDNNSFSDKQLGSWFVKNDNGLITSEVFANKVLEYLWDDVFTYEKTKLFNKSINSLADIIKKIEEESYDSIFSEGFIPKINDARNEINMKISYIGKKSDNTSAITRLGKRISFNEVGLQEGSVLKMHYGDKDYQCTVADDKAVIMDDIRYETLSACTRKIMQKDDKQSPGKVSEIWFSVSNGKTLKELQFGETE